MVTDPQNRLAELLNEMVAPDSSVAFLLCDRHPADATALIFVDSELQAQEVTYGQLRQRSEQLASGLAAIGVGPGDRVATLMAKSYDLVTTLLAVWRLGAVHVPLFTAFAPPAVELRLIASAASVVVADADQAPKLRGMRGEWQVVAPNERLSIEDLLEFGTSPAPAPPAALPNTEFVRLFTSGTTGVPKGVSVPLRAIAAFQAYLEFGLDVRNTDVFWNAADPGWAYGLYYAVIAPLAAGRCSLMLSTGFSPELTMQIIERFGVTNFAAAPTVYRALRNHLGDHIASVKLRCCSSAGEPLYPDVVEWSADALGAAIHDHYGQTELGMVAGNAQHPALQAVVRPGSMGHALPGCELAVLQPDEDVPAPAGAAGRLAMDTSSPLFWFGGYAGDTTRTAERFSSDGRWYLTGDTAARDADGYISFSARDDDVIIMAGYRIGPFEVESALASHPAVAESAVVGVPDELKGEAIAAFVVLAAGHEPSDELSDQLRKHVKTTFAAHAAPRSILYVTELPKTPSGKIQRFVLRSPEYISVQS
jgi:acetyl-CoA synthetase